MFIFNSVTYLKQVLMIRVGRFPCRSSMLLLSGRISSMIAAWIFSNAFSGFGAYVEYDIVPWEKNENLRCHMSFKPT